MSSAGTVNVKELSKQQQWCIDLRKILKLKEGFINIRKTDEEKLKRADEAVRSGLTELSKKNPEKFQEIGKRYKTLAEQSKGLGQGDENAILIVTEELDVLDKQVKFALALEAAKNKPVESKEGKALGKASTEFQAAKQKLHDRTEKLLVQNERDISEIKVQPYALLSASYILLNDTCTRWRTAFDQADQDANVVFDYARALTELAGGPQLAKLAKAEYKADQDEAVKQAEYKARYESKVERLQKVKIELTGHLGTEADIEKIAKALKAGENALAVPPRSHVKEPKYHTAFEAIKKIIDKTSDFEKNSLKQETTLLKDLLKDKEVASKWQAAQKALAALAINGSELVTSAEHAEFESQLNASLGKCANPQTKAQGLKGLETLTKDFLDLDSERSVDRKAYNLLHPQIVAGLKTLSFAPSDDERALINGWNSRLRIAETNCGNCEFEPALDELQEIETELNDALKTSGTTSDKWSEKWSDNEHQEMRLWIKGQITALAPKGMKPQDTLQAKVLSRCEKMAAGGDFPGAIQMLEDLHSDTKRQLANKDFVASDDFRAADKLVADEVAVARKSLDKLLQALQATDTQGVAAKLQTARLTEIETRWNTRKGSAVTEDDLDTDSYVKQLQTLTADYERVLKNPKAVQGIITQATLKADITALAAATTQVNAALDQLALRNRGQVFDQLAKARDKITDGAPDPTGGYPASATAMRELLVKVQTATSDAETKHVEQLKSFNQKVQEVRTAIDTLKKEADKKLKKGKQKDFFAPYFKELDTDHASLADFAKSSSSSMLTQGELELVRMEKRIEQMRADMNEPVGSLAELVGNALGKNDVDPTDEVEEGFGLVALFSEEPIDEQAEPKLSDSVKATFQLVAAAAADLAQQLKNVNLAKCKPTRLAMLTEDFGKLQNDIKSLEPAAGLKALFKFQKTLSENIDVADNAAARRDEFNTQLKVEAKNLYKGITQYEPEARLSKVGKEQKAVYEEWSKQFTAAKALIETEDKEQEAIDKITDLIGKLKRAPNGNELSKMETEAQQRSLQAKKDAEAWDMAVRQYEKVTLPEVEEALKVDGADHTQLEDCKNLLKKAKDQFKATQSFVGADAILEMARERARVAVQFPLGTQATARNELPKSVARWKKAITSFNKSLDDVTGQIKSDVDTAIQEKAKQQQKQKQKGNSEQPVEEEDDGVEVAAGKAIDVLKELKRAFNPTAFDKVVSVMAAKKVEARAARAAREEGLREVRRYFDLLYKDPVLVKLMQNPRPFGIVEESAVYTALRDLDLNLQRGA